MSKKDNFDPSKVNLMDFTGGKEEFDYKFASKDMFEYNKMQGWETVNINEDKIEPGVMLKNAGLPADGTLQTKHNILMRRPKKIGEQVRKAKEDLHRSRLKSINEAWRDLKDAQRREDDRATADAVARIKNLTRG
jgi:hypothetical protein